jgi:arylsulfatase A-like enzyme
MTWWKLGTKAGGAFVSSDSYGTGFAGGPAGPHERSMTKMDPAERRASLPVSARGPVGARRLGPHGVWALSAWCGLAAGWLEVGTRVLCRSIDSTNRLNQMSRHFVWLVPLANLLLFAVFGTLLAVATKLCPRSGSWISPRILLAAAVLPALLVASPQIHTAAWLLLALGIGAQLAARLERPTTWWRRGLFGSFPALLGSVGILAGLVLGGERLDQWREAGRPLPPADAPNVLLIVLDTVRADHLSLSGYFRPTSPSLKRLAERGIRFDGARATAPWTLPSHASLFTGRWASELGVKWKTPLPDRFPTLAAYLGARGYATAGFVANNLYCSADAGLDRGFTHYEDYVLDWGRLQPLRTALLVDGAWSAAAKLGLWIARNLDAGPFRPWLESVVRRLLDIGRKDAGSINRAFLGWLSQRRDPRRPFFAFLNYFDAHSPYLPPAGTEFRFGLAPQTDAEFLLLDEYWKDVDHLRLPRHYQLLVRDSYDNCIAYLDERLGELFDALQQSGVLDRTLVIVTADHGEELGEHALFDHGESLYRPETHVPLLVVLPESNRVSGVVRECVSLRDLPATIVDLVGLVDGSPFPGRSLAKLWRPRAPGDAPDDGDVVGVISELSEPNPSLPSQGRSPAARGPLVSFAEGDFVYIRNEGDGSEELFHERDDPLELRNRARDAAMKPVLQRLSQHLDRMRSGPSRAGRSSHTK